MRFEEVGRHFLNFSLLYSFLTMNHESRICSWGFNRDFLVAFTKLLSGSFSRFFNFERTAYLHPTSVEIPLVFEDAGGNLRGNLCRHATYLRLWRGSADHEGRAACSYVHSVTSVAHIRLLCIFGSLRAHIVESPRREIC